MTRVKTGVLLVSRPHKLPEETKGRISLTPKRENVEYAKAKHKNVSAWFDEKIEEEQSVDSVFRRAIKASKLNALKVRTDDALKEFQEEENCSIDQAIKDFEAVKAEAANSKITEAQRAEDSKLDALIEGLGERTGSFAINWLSARAKDFGFKESAVDLLEMISEYRKRKASGG